MPRTAGLNETEQLVMLALGHIGEGSYGINVRDEIAQRAGRSLSVAAVYAALDRLERAGLVGSTISTPSPERGGRSRKCFRLNPSGVAALLAERDVMARMWKGVKLTASP